MDRIAFLEERRPGITKIARRIAGEHPEWSEEAVAAHAKVLYASPTLCVRVRGHLLEKSNPDYCAGRNTEGGAA